MRLRVPEEPGNWSLLGRVCETAEAIPGETKLSREEISGKEVLYWDFLLLMWLRKSFQGKGRRNPHFISELRSFLQKEGKWDVIVLGKKIWKT